MCPYANTDTVHVSIDVGYMQACICVNNYVFRRLVNVLEEIQIYEVKSDHIFLFFFNQYSIVLILCSAYSAHYDGQEVISSSCFSFYSWKLIDSLETV